MGIGEPNQSKGKVTQEQAFEVWQREDEHCPLCGKGLAEPPAPHHIFCKAVYHGDDRDGNWNLAPLCMSCHKKFDGGKPKEEHLDKKLKQMALERYSGENEDKLRSIYKSKGYEI